MNVCALQHTLHRHSGRDNYLFADSSEILLRFLFDDQNTAEQIRSESTYIHAHMPGYVLPSNAMVLASLTDAGQVSSS